jgi:hypothetical protein
VEFHTPEECLAAEKKLRNVSLNGLRLKASHVTPDRWDFRTRGIKGKRDAIQRGLLTGTGPDAGLTERGTAVILSGLPAKMEELHMRKRLPDYELRGDLRSIIKLPMYVQPMKRQCHLFDVCPTYLGEGRRQGSLFSQAQSRKRIGWSVIYTEPSTTRRVGVGHTKFKHG